MVFFRDRGPKKKTKSGLLHETSIIFSFCSLFGSLDSKNLVGHRPPLIILKDYRGILALFGGALLRPILRERRQGGRVRVEREEYLFLLAL